MQYKLVLYSGDIQLDKIENLPICSYSRYRSLKYLRGHISLMYTKINNEIAS